MFYTPRFSYGVPETVICHCPRCSWHGWSVCMTSWLSGGAGRVGIQGGYRGGYTGWVIPVHQGPRPSGGDTSEAGPVGPAGAGVGGYPCSAHGPSRPSTQNPPSGPGQSPAVPSLVLGPLPGSGPIGRDSTTFLIKLVKTAECHQNMSKRPLIVPNLKTGP